MKNKPHGNTGKIRSAETRKKIGDASRGRVPTEYTKKLISQHLIGRYIKRAPWTDARKRAASLRMRGYRAPNWKGGVSNRNALIRGCAEYRLWRDAFFKKDNYSCVRCGLKNGNGVEIYLQADHIKPFSNIISDNNIKTLRDAIKCTELWDINNGRTLCIQCHRVDFSYYKRKKELEARNLY